MALPRKVHRQGRMDIPDAPVSQSDQALRGQAHALLVVEVEPRKALGVLGPAIRDEGHRRLQQKIDARVVPQGAGHDEAVHTPTTHQPLVGGQFVAFARGGNQQVHLRGIQGIGQSVDHLDELGVTQRCGIHRVHHADGVGPAQGQPAGSGVGSIAQARGCFHHALARGLAHVGVPIEGTTDRGGRQRQVRGELLQIHGTVDR